MSTVHPLTLTSVPTLATLTQTFPGVDTFLFDMDGTLFDTEKYHTLAMQAIGHEQKVIPPFGPKELHALMMGKADHLVFEIIKDWPGFPPSWSCRDFVDEKNRHLLKLLSSVNGSTFISPLITSLLAELNQSKLKVGLVTSSEKVITEELLKLANIAGQFSFILTRDDSLKVKPDPWPYLKAMDFFKSSAGETLVFEDSNVGLEAARASGAHVVKAQWY